MASLVSDCRGQVRPGRRERCGAFAPVHVAWPRAVVPALCGVRVDALAVGYARNVVVVGFARCVSWRGIRAASELSGWHRLSTAHVPCVVNGVSGPDGGPRPAEGRVCCGTRVVRGLSWFG